MVLKNKKFRAFQHIIFIKAFTWYNGSNNNIECKLCLIEADLLKAK